MPTPFDDYLTESLLKIAREFVAESNGTLRDDGPWWTPAGTPRLGGIPYYLWTWSDLDDCREASRRMLTHNEFAIGGLRTRTAYVVDQGFDFGLAPVEGKAVSPQEARDLKSWLRLLVSANELMTQSKRAQYRYDADGAVLWRLFPDSSGVADVRFVRPERVRPPGTAGSDADPADPEKWGVIVEQGDAERVTAYWVEPGVGKEAEEVPEAEVVHHYASDDGGLPVGVPIYQPVFQNLKRCEDLLTSMSAIAKARAKIAIIRYVTGLHEVKADNIRSQLLNGRQQQPDGTSSNVNIEQFPYGTVMRVSDKERLEFPNNNVGAGDLIQVLQADLRSVGSLLTMPEWMFTGLADQKYSNAFVVEAPTLKVFRSLQSSLVEKLGTGRYRRQASVVWRALRLASEAGHFSRDLLSRVEVKVTHPSLEVRDKAGEASTNATYLTAGVIDLQTVRESLGLDNAEVVRRLEEQKQEAPSVPSVGPPLRRGANPPAVAESHAEYAGQWYTESALQWVLEGRDASKLNRVKRTDKNGVRRYVWVRRYDPAAPATPKEGDHSEKDHAAHVAGVHAKLADPSKLTAADRAALPADLAKLSSHDLAHLQGRLGLSNGGGSRAGRVARILEKAGRPAAVPPPVPPKPVPVPKPKPNPAGPKPPAKVAAPKGHGPAADLIARMSAAKPSPAAAKLRSAELKAQRAYSLAVSDTGQSPRVYDAAYAAFNAARTAREDAERADFLDHCRATGGGGPVPVLTSKEDWHNYDKGKWADAAATIGAVAGKGMPSVPVVHVERLADPDGRAYYSPGRKTIASRPITPVHTYVHELGHHMETSIPGCHEGCLAFAARRFGPEPPAKLNDLFAGRKYLDDEYGRKDDFGKLFPNDPHLAYYVGKPYPGIRATEVLSMGVELLHRDAKRFAKVDPDYFSFTVNALRGDFSEPKAKG